MRINLEISDELCRQARRCAVRKGITLRELIETALTHYLSKDLPLAPYRLRWGTESGRILPGVRLDSRDSLFDHMEQRA